MSLPLKPLALTMGEPAGIGPEITLKAWRLRDKHAFEPFFTLGAHDVLHDVAKSLDLPVKFQRIEHTDEVAKIFSTALPIMEIDLESPVTLGAPNQATAQAVLTSISRGVELVQTGQASALVTNPIQKEILKKAGFGYPGHTEYLASLTGLKPTPTPIMMLASDPLRVVPVTIHLPLKEVAAKLTSAAIVTAGQIAAAALQKYFGMAHPRLAVAGLNPHAGEGGVFGKEDQEIIAPAIQTLKADGINAFGPLAADSLFHERARATYDVALCMYHDQALIPVKTLAFDDAVNVTLGLPFIRTSPDHGTGLDIAGKGLANPASLIAALKLGSDMALAAHTDRAAAT